MNPSHGLSWEKSGEQEGVFATLFILTGKLPEYIDIIAKCPASTWCNIPLPDAILSTNRVIDVNRPADSDSNVYGVIWWPSADKQITILRINTNGTNLTIDNTAKTIKLRIWFC